MSSSISISYESIKKVHNIFRGSSIHEVRIWDVYINDKNQYLLASSPGIFILRKNLSLKTTIFISKINKIEVRTDYIKIYYNLDKSLVFRQENQLKIAFFIYDLRTELFDIINYPFELDIENGLKASFYQISNILKEGSKLAQRFLANVAEKNKLDSKKIDNIYKMLSKVTHVFIVDKKLLNLPYDDAIADSVSCDSEINEIRIEDMNFCDSFKYLLKIIKQTRSIKTIIFNKVIFFGDINEYTELVHTKTNFPNRWIFNQCIFDDTKVVTDFFKTFDSYDGIINALVFNDCNFNNNLSIIFSRCLYKNISKCFKNLSVLWISKISENIYDSLNRLFCLEWVLKEKPFQHIVLNNCNLNINKLFYNRINISTFDFSGNIIDGAIDTNFLATQANLIVSNCNFSFDDSLFLFLKSLSEYQGSQLSLDCSNISISDICWNKFHHIENPIIINSLTSLNWDNNILNDTNIKGFINFLKYQPKLTSLSLSDCIENGKGIDAILQQLSNFIKESKLTAFTIKSTKPITSLGYLLIPIIKELFSNCIQYLDITGQSIGEIGLTIIVENIPKLMKSFYFTGNNISSVQNFNFIVDSIKNKVLYNSSWPESDYNNLKNIKGQEKERMESIKIEFFKKFGEPLNSSCNDPIDIILNKIKPKNLMKVKSSNNIHYEDLEHIHSFEESKEQVYENFWVNDPEVEKLMRKCDINCKDDPVKNAFSFYDHRLAVASLHSELFK